MCTIDAEKLSTIAKLARVDNDTAEKIMYYDWNEGQEHIDWINNASPEEIADWLAVIISQQQERKNEMENTIDFGTVMHNGKEYKLFNQAEPTNRCFPGCYLEADYNDGRYTDEWSAMGTDANGNQVVVTWRFDMVKGQEPEDAGEYPFEDQNIISVEGV